LIQRKPTIHSPGDPFEREANELADKVMRMDERASIGSLPAKIQRKSPEREEEEETPIRTATAPSGPKSAVRDGRTTTRAIKGSGAPLPQEARSYFEPRFGYDFSRVRVHADGEAEQMARLEHARAYTFGCDIVFGSGEYAPGTAEGQRLLAHELVHVVQQAGGSTQGTLAAYREQPKNAAQGTRSRVLPTGPAADAGGDRVGLLRPLDHPMSARDVIQRKDDPKSGDAAKDDKKTPAVNVERLDYAFIFAHDAYGEDAKRYLQTFYPDHRMVVVHSLEEMIDHMWADTNEASETHRFRIREIIIVSHGNAKGGMTSVSLVPGGKAKFSPPDMVKLQQDFHNGLYRRFQTHRADVISRAIDENTHVEIKGCRIGQSEDALEALRSFMGGEATVNAPTTYQGFDTVQVPGPVFKDKDAAYDALLGSHIDLPEKLVCRADETKAACIDRNFPNGRIPSQFFVTSDEDREKFKTIQTNVTKGKESPGQGQAEAEPLKHRDESAADVRSSRPSLLGQVSYDDSLSVGEIEQQAKGILANYRPERAYMLVSLRQAWTRKKLDEPMTSSPDPLEGLPPESIFGDPNIVGPDASRFPGPTGAVDTFTTDVPAETPEVSAAARAAYGADETSSIEGAARVAPTHGADATKAGAMNLPPDKLTPTPDMPKPPLGVDVAKPGGKKPDTALVLRGDFTKSFEIKYERELGYLKVKKATVDFNGKIDFKGEGEKELIISAFGALSSKSGESASGGGEKAETTLAKGTDAKTGVSGKVTGGLSIGGQERTKEGEAAPSSQRGMKAQLYLGTQVAWGPVAQELKLIIVGIDETKSGTDVWTVLGIDWSPIVVQGDFELPVSDGTKVKFSGTMRLTISAEPNWAKIGLRLAQITGRQVVAEGAVVAGGTATATGVGVGETAAGGAAGTGLGELLIAGGFVAGAAVLVYSYYKSVQEIEDLKELQRGADQGVADFCGGYLAQVGIPAGGQAAGALWKEGQRHAEINLKARVARAAQFLNEKYQKHLFTDNDPELRTAVLEGVKQDSDSWRKAVYLSYEPAVRTLFYKAWQQRVQGTAQTAQTLNARARAGLSSIDLADEPNYDYINAVGRRAATGMRLPANVR
jgi:hypothetical protein